MTTTDDLTTRLDRIERMQEQILTAIKPPRLMSVPEAAQEVLPF